MNRKWLVLGALSAAAVGSTLGFAVGRARAGIPATKPMTYSGSLSDASGPLTGTRNIQLTMWDAVTAGSAQCSVPPAPVPLGAGGEFHIVLPEECVTAVHAKQDLWIELYVEGASLGRAKLGAVPYAVEADHAVNADNAKNAVNATNATNATVAATANAAGGALDTRIAAIEGHTLKEVFRSAITPADDGITGGHASLCVNSLPLASCFVAASRKCANLGYTTGWLEGESSDGTYRTIICIK